MWLFSIKSKTTQMKLVECLANPKVPNDCFTTNFILKCRGSTFEWVSILSECIDAVFNGIRQISVNALFIWLDFSQFVIHFIHQTIYVQVHSIQTCDLILEKLTKNDDFTQNCRFFVLNKSILDAKWRFLIKNWFCSPLKNDDFGWRNRDFFQN